MTIPELLPKLTVFQQNAAEKLSSIIGMDLFLKSSIFRSMKAGNKSLVFKELEKWGNRISENEKKEIRNLWEKLG